LSTHLFVVYSGQTKRRRHDTLCRKDHREISSFFLLPVGMATPVVLKDTTTTLLLELAAAKTF